jgi:hypothetical protein
MIAITAGPSFVPTPLSDRGSQPFPCRLPFAEVFGPRPRSRRRAQRSAEVLRAKCMVNALVSLFSYYEVGCPKSKEEVAKALRRFCVAAPLSPIQSEFAHNLLGEVRPFCRALPFLSGAPRGISQFAHVMNSICTHQYDTTELSAACAAEDLVCGALNVDLSRISLPDHGAECRPEDHLLEPRRSLFNSLLSAVDPVVDPLPSHITP